MSETHINKVLSPLASACLQTQLSRPTGDLTQAGSALVTVWVSTRQALVIQSFLSLFASCVDWYCILDRLLPAFCNIVLFGLWCSVTRLDCTQSFCCRLSSLVTRGLESWHETSKMKLLIKVIKRKQEFLQTGPYFQSLWSLHGEGIPWSAGGHFPNRFTLSLDLTCQHCGSLTYLTIHGVRQMIAGTSLWTTASLQQTMRPHNVFGIYCARMDSFGLAGFTWSHLSLNVLFFFFFFACCPRISHYPKWAASYHKYKYIYMYICQTA